MWMQALDDLNSTALGLTKTSLSGRRSRRFNLLLVRLVNDALGLLGDGDGYHLSQVGTMLVRGHPDRVALEGHNNISLTDGVEQCPLPIGMADFADHVAQRDARLLQRANVLALVHQKPRRGHTPR